MTAPLRLLIIDDHPLFRKGAAQIIAMASEFELVGEASGGAEGLELARRHKPDMILLDLNMKDMSGIEVLAALRDVLPDTRIVMLTVSDEAADLVAVLRAGADGYLLKEDSDTELLPAIAKVRQGELYISPNLAGEFPEDIIASCTRWRETDGEILTPREKQILQLIAEGKPNKEIAALLDLSVNTVSVHRANIMDKLNIHRTAELVLYAVRMGLVRVP